MLARKRNLQKWRPKKKLLCNNIEDIVLDIFFFCFQQRNNNRNVCAEEKIVIQNIGFLNILIANISHFLKNLIIL